MEFKATALHLMTLLSFPIVLWSWGTPTAFMEIYSHFDNWVDLKALSILVLRGGFVCFHVISLFSCDQAFFVESEKYLKSLCGI